MRKSSATETPARVGGGYESIDRLSSDEVGQTAKARKRSRNDKRTHDACLSETQKDVVCPSVSEIQTVTACLSELENQTKIALPTTPSEPGWTRDPSAKSVPGKVGEPDDDSVPRC